MDKTKKIIYIEEYIIRLLYKNKLIYIKEPI
jgi:hypothetical protein